MGAIQLKVFKSEINKDWLEILMLEISVWTGSRYFCISAFKMEEKCG